MNFILFLSEFMIPFLVFYVVGYGLLMKKNVYDDFVRGAKDGMHTVAGILPTLVGLMIGVGVLRASGFLEFIAVYIGKVTVYLNFPAQLVPLAIVKMFSSSAATGLVLDIFKEYGTDSYIGLITSIMMSCTETIFYTMSVYFLCAKVTKTRWTLAGALISTFAGIVASVLIAAWMIAGGHA